MILRNFLKTYIPGPLLCLAVSAGFVLFSESCAHWFIIPVTLCGMLLIEDAGKWMLGKIDIFDPLGLVAIFGLYFFYLAPILNVHWDLWMRNVIPPADWRPWLGYMGILNLTGLIVYTGIVRKRSVAAVHVRDSFYKLKFGPFLFLSSAFMLISLALQAYVYHKLGGLEGYIGAYESRSGAFRGMGWIFIISESLPILFFITFAVIVKKFPAFRHWGLLALAMIIFFVLQLIFGGLRGSRSNTIWGLFWAVGVIHFWIRPISRKIVFSGVAFLLLFMYVYGQYKSYGKEAFSALINPLGIMEMAEKRGRTFKRLLLGDLARSDVQAYLFYSIMDPQKNYAYKWGITYLKSMTLLLPKSLRPDWPGPREAGTELQTGRYPQSEGALSSKVYGLAGEAMLNGGPFLVPLAFGLLALLIVKVRQFFPGTTLPDVRMLFLPFIVNLLIVIIIGDSDNILFFLVKNGSVPCLVVLLASQRKRIKTLRVEAPMP